MTRRYRFRVALVCTLALAGFGLLYASGTLLIASVIPLSYALYDTVSTLPDSTGLTIERTLDGSGPAPGESVTVSVSVRNETERVLPDVRVIDGVPEPLAVVTGSPRGCFALAPGESAQFDYDVVARRGTHEFESPQVRIRSIAGSDRITRTEQTTGDSQLLCANAVRTAPTEPRALPRAGTRPADSGGSGLEFYATREYRHGDPINRIDWRHLAKRGEFTTVQYREQRAVVTVIVVDARTVCRVTPQAGYPTGAALSAYAAERLHETLSAAGIDTAIVAVGVDDEALSGPDGIAWAESGDRFRTAPAAVFRGVRAIAEDAPAALSMTTPTRSARADGGGDEQIRAVLSRLPPTAQVVCCSPLLDNWPVSLAETLTQRGYRTLTVSPSVTADATVGQRMGEIPRRLRLRALGRAGVRTVDWDVDRPVESALRQSLPHLYGNP
ncbi:DUF58 domain-containing protein [Halovenus marina]|uniref:DUF58 domain-containing protein n=1 Tax=Halovenus marina TaxID=3396621 RepID=UPI003F56FC39